MSNSSHSAQSDSNRSGQNYYPEVTVEVGHVKFNPNGDAIEASGDLQNNKFTLETLFSIVNTLRLHSMMKLSKDNFRGITIQFTDHYYKIDLSNENVDVYKYVLTKPTVKV